MTKNKRQIKVLKRDRRPEPEKDLSEEQLLVKEEQDRIDDDREMTRAVRNWIVERRENRTAEDTESASQISEWNVDPDAS